MSAPMDRLRNFAIIAHIDHGKSTLADRLLEECGALTDRQKRDQFLDKMELEQERGITIKAQTVRLATEHEGQEYILNLIDTPGHVDFSYEVARSLQACEGAVLLVDAAQGVEAQTLANAYLAIEQDLTLIPVLNKLDLPSAEPERVRAEIEEVVGLPADEALSVSAKSGEGIRDLLRAIIERIPAPTGEADGPLRALVFDSWYDNYRGVIVLVRVIDGVLRAHDKVRLMSMGRDYEAQEVGFQTPDMTSVPELNAGEVGYLICGIKDVADVRVGETVTTVAGAATEALPGFVPVKSMVYSGVFPVDSADYNDLRDALEKLRLNDGSFSFEPETSVALGFGFRIGFLGLLHMEVIQERLEREYDMDLITTAPSVRYQMRHMDGTVDEIHKPGDLELRQGDKVAEPIYKSSIHVPAEYVGPVLKLCQDRRGKQRGMTYVGSDRVIIEYDMPVAEVVFDFHDRLKGCSRGYASLDYEFTGYSEADLVRVDILVNGENVDALSIICHRDNAFFRGSALCRKLKQIIHRQMFEVAIQASIGTRVIARTTVKAFRKAVTAKCYGGDVSRKRKLLEKQKKGKKRMKQMGNVEIPQEAFHAVLKIGD